VLRSVRLRLLFQFDPIRMRMPRGEQKDLHLLLCDDIHFMDRKREVIERFQYDFALVRIPRRSRARCRRGAHSAAGAPPEIVSTTRRKSTPPSREGAAGMKQATIRSVLRQSFSAGFGDSPADCSAACSTALRAVPVSAAVGDEQLVGASPEMFVRSRTARGKLPDLEPRGARATAADHDLILALLNSPKEESELTMCTTSTATTSRACALPGSVKVIGRRLIERYAACSIPWITSRAFSTRASIRSTHSGPRCGRHHDRRSEEGASRH